MAILYYDDKKLFQLNTEKTTYVIGLSPEGYVGHVYYGPLLHGEPDLYPLRMDEPPFTPSVNKREKSSFLDRFPMEYPTGGIGDYRESCLNVRNAQGRMGCEIHFDSYEIFKGKRKMEGLPASFGTEEEVERHWKSPAKIRSLDSLLFFPTLFLKKKTLSPEASV